jgi:hypothetical protein
MFGHILCGPKRPLLATAVNKVTWHHLVSYVRQPSSFLVKLLILGEKVLALNFGALQS